MIKTRGAISSVPFQIRVGRNRNVGRKASPEGSSRKQARGLENEPRRTIPNATPQGTPLNITWQIPQLDAEGRQKPQNVARNPAGK
jgi:hypothetical protein